MDLKNCDWKPFKMEDILDITPCAFSGRGVTQKGDVPYVGATNRNNGVLDFLDVDKSQVIKGNCLVFICNGDGSIGYSVYRETDFVGSVDVKIGRSKYLNRYIGLFISAVSDKNRSRYSFGYKRTIPRIKKEVIMLPSKTDGKPDYVFMEEYMKRKEADIISLYESYINETLTYQEDYNEEIVWRPFKVTDIFTPLKGNQNNMNILSAGDIPLVSAKNINNGLKAFVGKNKKKVYSGHCLSINNDGDGGAGLTFYHPYMMYLDSHVSALYSKVPISKYSYLFMAKCLEMQESMFGHGRALTSDRLSSLTFMLPSINENEPDYVYMDNFMRKKEAEILLKYLNQKKIVKPCLGN